MLVELLKNDMEWDEFLRHSPSGTFFHSLKWKEVIQRSFPYGALYLTIRDSKGKLVGICPGFIESEMHLKIYHSLPHSDYGGPVIIPCCAEEASVALRDFLQSFCSQKRIAYGKICIMDDALGQFFQSPLGQVDTSVGVVEIDLKATPSDFIWNRLLSASDRRHIKRIERKGFEAREAKSRSDLKDFHRLYCSNMKYIGASPHSYEFAENMWALLYPANLRIWLLEKEKRIGGILVFKYGQKTYAVYAGIDRQQYDTQYSIVPFLLWKEIKAAEEEGYRYFSLGATTSDITSLYHLQKTGFGGRFFQQKIMWYPFTRLGSMLTLTRARTISTWKNIRRFLPEDLRQSLERRLSKF
jgi:hypothetical protein